MSAAAEPAAPRAAAGPGLLRESEFRAVRASYALSSAGDRLALVAVTLLVYARTRSPFLAALTFASGTIPYLAGGLLLGGLADRVPRRSVMIGCDLARAVLAAVMLLPGMPLPTLIAVLYAVGVAQPPADAARSAVIRDIVTGEAYVRAVTLIQVTFRVVLIAGAAGGGLAVAVIGARPAIGADAATFAVSALVTRLAVRSRPAPAAPARSRDRARASDHGTRVAADVAGRRPSRRQAPRPAPGARPARPAAGGPGRLVHRAPLAACVPGRPQQRPGRLPPALPDQTAVTVFALRARQCRRARRSGSGVPGSMTRAGQVNAVRSPAW